MVKNAVGGNKSKKQARKNVPVSSQVGVRRIKEACEMYAAVTKIYSGKRCDIIGTDGITRACNVRGKFLKRRSGPDMLAIGSWIMVGFYEWEVRSDGQKTCDLLEIYSAIERDKLKQIETPQALGAIINIGDGVKGDCTFSNFMPDEARGGEEEDESEDDEAADVAGVDYLSSSEDDEEKPLPPAKLAPAKLAPTKLAPAKPVATKLKDLMAVKTKESLQDQMDWLSIKVDDI